MDVNLNANLAGMELDQLLEHQQELSRQRKAVLDRQVAVQRELDRRAVAIAERRRQEDQLLGQASKPPAQEVFGEAVTDAEAGS